MITNGPVYLKPVGSSDDYATISIGAGETGYSAAFELIDLNDFSLEYKANCTGSPNVKLQLQERGSVDVDWSEPDNMGSIKAALEDKNQHLCHLAPYPARFIRIKAVEQTITVTDTVITIRVIAQRKYPA